MLRSIFLLGITLAAVNCQSVGKAYHNVIMKGRVVSATGNEGVICIGSKDGAEVGQIWKTARIEIRGTGKTSKHIWVPAGSVKIVEIIDEHFARVNAVEGKLETDFVAELQAQQ